MSVESIARSIFLLQIDGREMNNLDDELHSASETDPFAMPEQVIEPDNPLPDFTFDQIDPTWQERLRAAGWSKLMPVQVKTIPYMLAGRDLIVQSKTGSGKTGAFLIPLLQVLEVNHPYPQALILLPTRELALQVEQEFRRLTVGTDLKCAILYGGVKYEPQIKALREGVHLVVATPGRLLDHLQKKNLDFRSLRDLVMDEADEMLSMGFYPDMKALQAYLPKQYCCTLFSATIPETVKSLSREFQMKDRGFLSLSQDQISTDALVHSYMVVDPMEKDSTIRRILEIEQPESCIIFCNMKRDVEYLGSYLTSRGFSVGILTGDVQQKLRQKTLTAFREQKLPILIATDVAARGIDISHVTHVLLHDHPDDSEVYIHRSGRTARAGRKGKAISVVTPVEEIALKKTANTFGIEFEKTAPPTQEEADQRIANLLIAGLERDLRNLSPAMTKRMRRYIPIAKHLISEERAEEFAYLLMNRWMAALGQYKIEDESDADQN